MKFFGNQSCAWLVVNVGGLIFSLHGSLDQIPRKQPAFLEPTSKVKGAGDDEEEDEDEDEDEAGRG